MATKRILLIGGATGGHAYPLIAVAQALRERAQQQGIDLKLLIIASGDLIEKAAAEQSIPFKRITAGKLRRYFSFLTVLDVFKVPISFIQSLWHVFWFMPNAVFSKGGYDSVAPGLVAWLFFIPLYIHDSDAVPGLANRFMARFAKAIFISFASSAAYFKGAAVLVGNPVRKELFSGTRSLALEFFRFSADKKTLLILGGSQGAQEINNVILASLVDLTKEYQVIHQCGPGQYDAFGKEVERLTTEGEGSYAGAIRANYRLTPFLDAKELALAYAACDLIVARAGSSVFEFAMAGKPVIVIPLANSGSGHQLANAMEFSKYGAVIVEGANMTPHILLNQIQLLLEPERFAQVSQQIRSFAAPDAADKIASAIIG